MPTPRLARRDRPPPRSEVRSEPSPEEAARPADDGFLSLRELARYSGLSRRTLWGFTTRSVAPLPCYQAGGGKILVRLSEFHTWITQHRRSAAAGRVDLERVVTEVVGELTARGTVAHSPPDPRPRR
jgi:hypothetical protein